jgi:ectoine hydroxylase-related dioxygenase (phytanoyl-CoA dioxygenase family)
VLSNDQLALFHRQGFLVVEHVLPEAQLRAVERDFSVRLDELAEHLGVRLPDGGIDEKMLALEAGSPGAALTFTHSVIMSAGVFDLWSSSPLLDLAMSVIGPDIDGHPFWAVRPKPPEVDLFVVPWHQDSAYLADGAQSFQQLGVWIPLTDVTAKNGCMQYAYRDGQETSHHPHELIENGRRSWYLEIDTEISDRFETVTCEIKRGSCILFSHLTPHRSLVNRSKACRWSLDLRYLAADAFAGTQQSPVPFHRRDPSQTAEIESRKRAFLDDALARNRQAWKYSVQDAVWQARWSPSPVAV